MDPVAQATIPAEAVSRTTGMRPLVMTGFFVQWLRRHFAAPALIEAPELRDLLWNADATQARITLGPAGLWDPSAANSSPAVLVARQEWTVEPVGIGDRVGVDGTGAEHFAVMVRGAHTLRVIAPEEGMAELLATEVYRDLLQFSPAIRATFGLKEFAVASVGAPAPLAEATGNVAITIPIRYAFEEAWSLTVAAPVIQRIVLRLARAAAAEVGALPAPCPCPPTF